MNKCKKCKGEIVPMNIFRFTKNVYKTITIQDFYEYDIIAKKANMLQKRFNTSPFIHLISNDTEEELNKYDKKMLCQQCMGELRTRIKIDDYELRGTEHLDTKRAHIPMVTVLNK